MDIADNHREPVAPSIRWATSISELSSIRESWRQLALANKKPFGSPDWLLTWWDERPVGPEQLCVLIAEDGGGLAAVVAMYADDDSPRPARLRLLGQPGLWGCGPLLRPDTSPRLLSAITAALAETDAEVLIFDGLEPDDAALVKTLADLWPAPGADLVTRFRSHTGTLTLDGTFDEWLFTRGRNWRGSYHRRRRRLADVGGSVERAVTAAGFAADIDSLIDLHDMRWDDRSQWLTPQLRGTLRRVAVALGPVGQLRLYTARLDGVAIASSVFASLGGRTMGLLNGTDRRHGRYGAGLLTWTAGIEEAFERGDTLLDLGWGDQSYKSDMTDDSNDALWHEIHTRTRRSHVEGWESGPPVTVADRCVHHLVEEWVRRTPDAPALISDEQKLTYAELDRRANRLAHHLAALGVGPDTIVAVCLDRSTELVVSLLAVLKAGGAYLPIDPSWPTAHKTRLLTQIGPQPLLICAPAAAADLVGQCRLVATNPEFPPGSETPPDSREHTPPQLAYVNFTSGSTGAPKGVLIEHRAIQRLLDPQAPWALGPGDRMLHLAPVTFDAATLEIWAPLCSGATVVVGPPGLNSLAQIADLITQQHITAIWLTAGLFHAMAAMYAPALASVRNVLAGGDVLHMESVRAVLDTMPPDHRLINGYGPTEGTTFTTCHVMSNGSVLPDQTSVPIGRPIPGTVVQVLDAAGKRCPVGELGEIYIGGTGLARGYLNDPGQDAAKFVSDSLDPDGRLYRSGDVGCWNKDGTLSFHGRVDSQIKVNGVCVEPAEITDCLKRHPAVSDAEVVLVSDDPRNPYLAAYWVSRHSSRRSEPSADELARFLRSLLPENMVPTAFVSLGELPLNANGKLDRRALPAPRSNRLSEPPRSDLEAQIWAAWSKVLGQDNFGVNDNFVLVGGNSVSAIRLSAELGEFLGQTLPARFAYQHPTVREQGLFLSQQKGSRSGGQCVVTLQPLGDANPVYLMHGWGGGLDHMFPLARAFSPHRPVLGISSAHLDPRVGVPALAETYADDILAKHPGGPIHLLGWSAGGWWAFATAGALLRRNADVGMIGLLDSADNPDVPPLLRISVRAQEMFGRITHAPPGQPWHRHAKAVTANKLFGPPPVAEGPFLQELRRESLQPLPVRVNLFCASSQRAARRTLWKYYARGGVECRAVFDDHLDFIDPQRAPELVGVLDDVMRRFETVSTQTSEVE
jgi:amino acid adenylation domain-containing protein